MFKWEKLTKSNMRYLKQLSFYNEIFNSLNSDFFSAYTNYNYFQRILQKRNVRILKYNSNYIGYIWVDSFSNLDCKILSLVMSEKVMYTGSNINLINPLFKKNSNVSYQCDCNSSNSKILSSLNFIKDFGIYEMIFSLNTSLNLYKENYEGKISFFNFKKNKDEQLRCDIQNEIFHTPNRIPIDINDIYLDEQQSYYIDNWSIFMKKGDKYIGFGQIILENRTPLIVNFGIIKDYRNLGYGKRLLYYLLNLLNKTGYKKVKIKVDCKNKAGINLYKKIGFKIKNEVYTWVLK
jgi:GNAT superfamily N-acetyltransferase